MEKVTYAESKGPTFGKRHVQAILQFFSIVLEMASRACVSLSIIAMTDSTTSSNPNIPTYDWSNTNVILSSFYWGYIALQLPAAQLVHSYGIKWFLFAAMLVNSLSMTLIPTFAALLGSTGVMICRAVQGVSQGFFYPSMQTMLGRWAPEEERSRMSMLVYTGSAIGTILCGPINGYICESHYGWPGTFYLFGGLGFVWCISWFFFGFSTPASHPTISAEERLYIEKSLGQDKGVENVPTPWTSILTSMPFYSVVLATVGITFGAAFLSSDMPTYLKNVVGYSTKTNGILSSVPTIAGIASNFIFALVSDFIVTRNYVSKLNSRKIFHVIGSYGPSTCMLILAYLPKSDVNLTMTYLIINGALASSQHYGVVINNLDISPRFAGVIGGFSSTISSSMSLCAPLLVQFLVTDETNVTQWRTIFIIAAGWYFVGATFFVIFASADVQPWDSGKIKKNAVEKIKKESVTSFKSNV
ncbi:unnamed protein product [Ceutorhynchus assimilis]|uniref:Putative inorganic phosphate cotransporter n=1 Tax=Ceutorhynchus assimilis TaxID=467358 RepID=A0A9N9MLQ0_9CUCU|nr:unnamed protein product [Ceutorhynchus assimilis]